MHDEYEIAIMHRKRLRIQWLDDSNESHTESVLPKDILVKSGEEFLIAESGETEGRDDAERCIRLDRITLLE